jgi:hypothetical protein
MSKKKHSENRKKIKIKNEKLKLENREEPGKPKEPDRRFRNLHKTGIKRY